jgi:hypothetical protein
MLTVTDATGASASDDIRVQVLPRLAAIAGADIDVLAGRAFTLNASAAGGTPPYRYSWSPAAIVVNPNAQSTQAIVAETTTFILTVSDAAGAVAEDTLLARITDPPRVSAGNDRAVAAGGLVTLSAVVTGGAPPFAYVWTSPALPQTGGAAALTFTARTTATYTVFVTDSLGQEDSDSVNVFIADPLTASAQAEPRRIVVGERTLLSASVSGGVEPYEFEWAPAEFVSSSTDASVEGSPAESTTFVLTARDRVGQERTATVDVEVVASRSALGVTGMCGFGVVSAVAASLAALLAFGARRGDPTPRLRFPAEQPPL